MPSTVWAAAVDKLKLIAGVVVEVATLVVKSGERLPAETAVTVPPPPVTAVMTPPEAVIVMPSTLTAPNAEAEPSGRSAGTIARNVGAAAEPVVGPARMVLALWLIGVATTEPEVVTAVDGVAESKIPSPVKVTLVTVPEPPPPDPRDTVAPLIRALRTLPVELYHISPLFKDEGLPATLPGLNPAKVLVGVPKKGTQD